MRPKSISHPMSKGQARNRRKCISAVEHVSHSFANAINTYAPRQKNANERDGRWFVVFCWAHCVNIQPNSFGEYNLVRFCRSS